MYTYNHIHTYGVCVCYSLGSIPLMNKVLLFRCPQASGGVPTAVVLPGASTFIDCEARMGWPFQTLSCLGERIGNLPKLPGIIASVVYFTNNLPGSFGTNHCCCLFHKFVATTVVLSGQVRCQFSVSGFTFICTLHASS